MSAPITAAADVDYVDLHAALDRLEELDERKAKIVELPYFGGLAIEEVAEILDLSPITVKREWRFARIWLFEQISA